MGAPVDTNHAPAFPELKSFNSDWASVPGMSLRDYFAAKALQGIMSQSHAGPKDWTKPGFGWGEDTVNSLNKGETHMAATVAQFCYQMADAMIAERSK